MMTIALNLTASVKIGIIPTAIEVPMPATVDVRTSITRPTSAARIAHACQ
jgi:hypothetical protein